MFFLKKIFKLRDHANPSAEKAFLEHLEDLRVCITRIILTLLIATVVCFIFRNELMDVMRRPVTQVWERSELKALEKSEIPLDEWEEAKRVAENFNQLLQPDRAHFLSQFENPEGMLNNIRAVTIYRAARIFEEREDQENYVNEDQSLDDALRSKILALIEGGPNPKSDARGKLVLMQALKPTEGFMLSIKLAFFAGIVVSFPFLLYFILQFVLPGMHAAERHALWPAMAIGFGLFLGGVFFSYFIVLPKVLEFFHDYSAQMKIENEWRIGYYISFATQFTLIFGLSFELPVLVMTLVKLNILNCEMMRRTRAYAILAIFIIAAIITPTPDAFTLCLLAGPMVILYEICIWLSFFLEKKGARREAEEEKVRLERLLALKKRRAERGEDDDDDDNDNDGGGDPGPGDDGTDPDFRGPATGLDHEHDEYHDHDPEDYDYHSDHDSLPDDHDHDPEYHHEGDLGHGDDGHTGTGEEDPQPEKKEAESGEPDSGTNKDDSDSGQQADFDFHEEADPTLTEEGEQEDVSDPWPDEEEDEHLDPHNPPEDIPEEERDRDRGNPDKLDQD
ncbi:MAG: twin-arginine translocase subunit TatC [Roseibacillus sp.]